MKALAVFSSYILAACFMGCCISGIYICFLSSFQVPPRKTFESDIEIREDICAIWGSNCTSKRPASYIFVDLKRILLAKRDQDGKNHYFFLHARKTIRIKKWQQANAQTSSQLCTSFFCVCVRRTLISAGIFRALRKQPTNQWATLSNMFTL